MTTIHEDIFLKDKRDVVKIEYGINTETSCTKNETGLAYALSTHKKGAVFMMKLPSEGYFTANVSTIKVLTDTGYEGVYVSFQRPFVNIFSLFHRQGINVDKLLIIDGAAACCDGMQAKHPRCVPISSSIDMKALTQTICRSLSRLKSKERFVCIDSLSTMALYESFSNPVKILEMLVQMVENKGFDHITFILNISEDLSQKRCFKEISRYTDECISIGVCV